MKINIVKINISKFGIHFDKEIIAGQLKPIIHTIKNELTLDKL